MFINLNLYLNVLNLYGNYVAIGFMSKSNNTYDALAVLLVNNDIYSVITTLLHNLL